jgi:hypothetical protein
MEPIQIRRILRAEKIKPKKVDVANGWPNQKRKQYVWKISDPELKLVLELIKKYNETAATKDLLKKI